MRRSRTVHRALRLTVQRFPLARRLESDESLDATDDLLKGGILGS